MLGLMTRVKRSDGKVLIIGGGIANFTDVAATFKGLIKAIRIYKDDILQGNVLFAENPQWCPLGTPLQRFSEDRELSLKSYETQ